MKISKLFHWLYAILMFLPFGLLIYNGLSSMWSGTPITDPSEWWSQINEISFTNSGLTSSIKDVYQYLVDNLFGITEDYQYHIVRLLTYWTSISIIWLIFDVFMYVPLLCHRWIDKAKIE